MLLTPTYYGASHGTSLAAWGGGIFLPSWKENSIKNFVGNAISSVFSSAGIYSNGGVATLSGGYGYPLSLEGLAPGSLWSNYGVVSIVQGYTPTTSSAVYYGQITASQLLALGGTSLPTTKPASGSLQLWNNGGLVSIA